MTTRPVIKVLTEAGFGSRRRVAEFIKQGLVEVNGAAIESFNHPVDSARDRLRVNGQAVNLRPAEIICLMLHKPDGIVSTVSDEKGRRTVLDILPARYRGLRLYPVGRLDKDTTGLILLTNDGDLTYRLTHPKFEHEKEYLVEIKGNLKPDEVRKLERGILLEDGLTHPTAVQTVTSHPPFNYSITLHEGRKRQVRRMFEHLEHPVLALKRVRLGGLTLGDLKEGEVRRLSPPEVKALTDR
ncbi:MAG: pseudouridine synthase [Chloroflexi bacterium RBG_16_58_8]|nr:MAG: pseudouridine synthase [Chloroflexi bacterium RBG_16_58_8]